MEVNIDLLYETRLSSNIQAWLYPLSQLCLKDKGNADKYKVRMKQVTRQRKHTSTKAEMLARLSHQKRKRKSHVELNSDNKSCVFFACVSTSTTSGSIPFWVYTV